MISGSKFFAVLILTTLAMNMLGDISFASSEFVSSDLNHYHSSLQNDGIAQQDMANATPNMDHCHFTQCHFGHCSHLKVSKAVIRINDSLLVKHAIENFLEHEGPNLEGPKRPPRFS